MKVINNKMINSKIKEKCLVIKAMDKCQCSFCVLERMNRENYRKWIVQYKLHEVLEKTLKENVK